MGEGKGSTLVQLLVVVLSLVAFRFAIASERQKTAKPERVRKKWSRKMTVNCNENGVEGDNEGGEEEEGEEEPRLRYQRMGGSIPSLLSKHAASCITIAERMIALGTREGTIHILDFQGNQVKEFSAHTATVNDLSFDSEGEYIGSCADDGCVVINGLFTDEKMKFEYRHPMKAIALDPDYTRKSSCRFVAGGLAGYLFRNSKKLLGHRDQVLHSGEGPIHAVKWRASLVAWANDAGVNIYDMANNQRITYIERPGGNPCPELLPPHLVWQDDTLLVIGWGTSVKIAVIRVNLYGGANGRQRNIHMSSMKHVNIVASFQTSYFISGIAPYGDSLVILAYIHKEENGENKFSSVVPSCQGTAQRPEVHIVTWKNDELTTDALPVYGFENYIAKDYSLVHASFSGHNYAADQWSCGDEPLYYIVSPKEMVIAKPRDAEDHISWLLQHGTHEKELAAVELGQVRTELLDEVGSGYLDHLILEGKYDEAASLCPKFLQGSAAAWERWFFNFAHLCQLPVLVPYIPTENPRLRDIAYEVALIALASNTAFHSELLSIVKSWPPQIYSALPVISAIEHQLNMSSTTDTLKEALAELYVINAKYEKAFALYADLMKPDIFDFIERHSLHDAAHDKVIPLMIVDCQRAIQLLIQHRDTITPSEVVSQLLNARKKCEVVSQLLNARKKCDHKYFLHLYLHCLFKANPYAGKEFHDLQIELYADYEPQMLLPFMRSCQHYKLYKAYEICVKRDLLREQAFILRRMGNFKQALAIIINKLEDIEGAIKFVRAQHDHELWKELFKQCLRKPKMAGVLLEHTVRNHDPLYIVNMVPNGMPIPRLRDILIKIITDCRTSTSLRHGCNDILKADRINLLVKYYKEARHAVLLGIEEDRAHMRTDVNRSTQAAERTIVQRNLEVKSRTRGDGRCCMCFDPLPIKNLSVIVFFCCHAYHITCLTGSSDSSSVSTSGEDPVSSHESASDYDDSDDETNGKFGPGRSQMRCILCTTAAA